MELLRGLWVATPRSQLPLLAALQCGDQNTVALAALSHAATPCRFSFFLVGPFPTAGTARMPYQAEPVLGTSRTAEG